MTRARLRAVVMLSGIGLLGGLALLLGRVLWRQADSDLAVRGLLLLPDVAQRIEDFHRVQVREGRKEWEISAQEASYFDDREEVTVRAPNLSVYMADGRRVGVKGERGTLSLDGRELRAVKLSGDIEVSLMDYVVRTEEAHYDRSRDWISAPGTVRISGNGIEARGGGLEVDVRGQRLRLERDVRMTLRARAGAEDGTP